MNKIIRYNLVHDKTFDYVNQNLEDGKTLSMLLAKAINLKKGTFFTLLPEKANIEEIYNFEKGGILPQYPKQNYDDTSITSTYSIIPNVREDVSKYIINQLNMFSNKSLSCIFDDVLSKANDPPDSFLISQGLQFIYNEELYYVINKSNASFENILYCLSASNTFWHSLGIISEFDASNYEKKIFIFDNLENIIKSCLQFFVGAYDGEGYIFWEKGQT